VERESTRSRPITAAVNQITVRITNGSLGERVREL
jgi:hypothetical protein